MGVVAGVEDVKVQEVGKDTEKISPIFVVCHAPAVVALADQIVKRLELVEVILVEHHLDLLAADGEVTGGELIRDIPAKRPETPPLLYHIMEEGQSVAQFEPLGGF